MGKQKKKFYKKWWFWVIVVVIVSAALATGNDDDSADNNKSKSNDKAVVETSADKEKSEKKDTTKKEPTPIDKKIIKNNNKIGEAKLENGVITLKTEVTTFWDETSLLKNNVYEHFESFGEAFKDKNVNAVKVVLSTKMIDNKGNEEVEEIITYEYSRAAFEELNYENFLDLSYSQSWRILNESDSYWIHPGIYKKVKKDYTKNLTYGISK